MTDNRVKEALCKICKSRGNGDEKEVKKIVDAHPSIINEVRRKGDGIVVVFIDIENNGWYDLIFFDRFWILMGIQYYY